MEERNEHQNESRYKLSLILIVALVCVAIFSLINMTGKLVNREKPEVTIPTTTAPITEPPVIRAEKTISNKSNGSLIVVNNANLYEIVSAPPSVYSNEYFNVRDNSIKLDETVVTLLTEAFKSYKEEVTEGYYKPVIKDAFRTLEEQETIYNNASDKTIASIAGGSDYHTGLSFRLSLEGDDGEHLPYTPWMKENLPKYGFVERYPASGNTDFKGTSVVWLGIYRYVGIPHSVYITENKISLEDYIAYLKEHHSVDENPEFELDDLLCIEFEDEKYYVLYIKADDNKATVSLPENTEIYSFSGDNIDGFVITLTELKEAPTEDATPSDNE
ncbi:MAG: D-alanyl-D-alanine carboxypeptidase family protein [Clostridia bacterium]|nr:D-alanyl-D-alanine carboxypeptidase family protein [Clostridia bacterium]